MLTELRSKKIFYFVKMSFNNITYWTVVLVLLVYHTNVKTKCT